MRQARSVQVTFVVDEDLGLVDKSAKRGGMDDAVTIALILTAIAGRWFCDPPAATGGFVRGIRSKYR
jgi:hypothetical protein